MKFNAEQLEKITANILCILLAILVSLFKYLYYSAQFSILAVKDVYKSMVWTVMNYISKFLIH